MIILPIALAMAFTTVRDLRGANSSDGVGRPPVPAEFLAAGGVMVGLTIVAQANEDLANLLAWGYLIAVVLQSAAKGKFTTAPAKAPGVGATSTA